MEHKLSICKATMLTVTPQNSCKTMQVKRNNTTFDDVDDSDDNDDKDISNGDEEDMEDADDD